MPFNDCACGALSWLSPLSLSHPVQRQCACPRVSAGSLRPTRVPDTCEPGHDVGRHLVVELLVALRPHRPFLESHECDNWRNFCTTTLTFFSALELVFPSLSVFWQNFASVCYRGE